MDSTPVVVTLTGGISENGKEKTLSTYTGFCYFEEGISTLRSKDGINFELKGKAIFGRDIAPSVAQIKGSVTINSVTYRILFANRFRNPDGTIHHIELGLV